MVAIKALGRIVSALKGHASIILGNEGSIIGLRCRIQVVGLRWFVADPSAAL